MRFRLTGLGLAAALVFVAFIVLAFVGSSTVQLVGFAGAVLVAIALVGGVPVGGEGGSDGYGITASERGRRISYAEHEVLDEAPADQAAWQRERERREGRFAGADETAERRPSADPYDPFRAGRGG